MRRAALALAVMVAACGGSSSASDSTTSTMAPALTTTTSDVDAEDACAHVVGVDVTRSDDGTYRFDVTVASSDTGWDKYADAWEVRGADGTALGTRELAHPHVDEQPFTRSLSGVEIPAGVEVVTVVARDSTVGFCGDAMEVTLE